MKLIVTKEHRSCKKCAGFGVFEFDPTRLEPCPTCGSIHIEMFGLSYRESKDDNYRFYVEKERKSFWSWKK